MDKETEVKKARGNRCSRYRLYEVVRAALPPGLPGQRYSIRGPDLGRSPEEKGEGTDLTRIFKVCLDLLDFEKKMCCLNGFADVVLFLMYSWDLLDNFLISLPHGNNKKPKTKTALGMAWGRVCKISSIRKYNDGDID